MLLMSQTSFDTEESKVVQLVPFCPSLLMLVSELCEPVVLTGVCLWS